TDLKSTKPRHTNKKPETSNTKWPISPKVIAAAVKTADTAAGILLRRQRNAPEQELNKKTSAKRRSYESVP
ncbi:hypothetical protein, partial [Trueperella pyogenes]|uniref:hypothetical protein n=1 Tax=Trueperella pyogenes TaxID=1661 RepID=UPI00345CB4DB